MKNLGLTVARFNVIIVLFKENILKTSIYKVGNAIFPIKKLRFTKQIIVLYKSEKNGLR